MKLRKISVYPHAERQRALMVNPSASADLPDPPDDIEKFYAELEYPFSDSKTNEPILEWTGYQRRAVKNHLKHRKFLLLKGQKMGISSLFIIVTLWHALTDCQSFELIVLAQSKEKAIEHGRDVRRFLANSAKYKDYLITRPSDAPGLLRDEITKMTEIYIKTKGNPNTPTKIHILSPSAGQISSLKRVKYAWLSDVTMVKDVADRQRLWFAALTSRLILTEGPVIIECPTVGHLGPIWEIDDRFQKAMAANKPPGPHEFWVDRLLVWEAVKAGLMTMEAVKALQKEHGPMFAALFLADWYAGDSTWYSKEQIRSSAAATRFADD